MSGKNAYGSTLARDQHVVNVAAYHGQQSMEQAFTGFDRDHRTAHDVFHRAIKRQCLRDYLFREVTVGDDTDRRPGGIDHEHAGRLRAGKHLRGFTDGGALVAEQWRRTRDVADGKRIEQAFGVAHEPGLGAQFLQAAVHVASYRGSKQKIGHLGIGGDETLHLFGGDAVAKRVFDGGDVEAGEVLAHEREQAEDFALAAHVEY